MKNYNTYILCILVFIFSACEKQELPVPKHTISNAITTSVDMSSNYQWQVYYDLETNCVVSKNYKTDWDLGFETGEDGFHVILNTSTSMFAFCTNSSDFESVLDTNGFSVNKRWDEPSGNLDSSAIGDWRTHDKVWIIDRGYSASGSALGFKKIKLLSVSNTAYTFQCASMNNSDSETINITKHNDYNFTFFSFNTGEEVLTIEPPKKNWDICFTQYLHIFHNPTQPYLVTGCVSNRYKTSSAIERLSPFQTINYTSIEHFSFSNAINSIGYDWKTYRGGLYVTDPTKVYLIKNRNNKYYKLHFIDFYSTGGSKGNPTWEYQAL